MSFHMCGIFGFVGRRYDAGQLVLRGLKKLDYRGYDSWGAAVIANGQITTLKSTDLLTGSEGQDLPQSDIALAHTRWATTGAVNIKNAHPHESTDGRFTLAQNGIVENHLELKQELTQLGYKFITDTDTEVIVRLIEHELTSSSSLQTAVQKAFARLTGRNTIILLDKVNHEILAVRNGSPLVVGKTKDGFILSSDTLSFANLATEYLVVENGQLVKAKETLTIFDVKTGEKLDHHFSPLKIESSDSSLSDFPHFMLKEIHDTPKVLNTISELTQNDFSQIATAVRFREKVFTIGSGTAGIAASLIAYYLRDTAHINAISLVGADCADCYQYFTKDTLILAPSQSGETADVIEILEIAKKQGARIATFVNMPGSMMTRMSDFPFMAAAGPEICVMSTKVFVAQVAWGFLLAHSIVGSHTTGQSVLKKLSSSIQKYLLDPKIQRGLISQAQKLAKQNHLFILGRGAGFHIAREAMVKFTEGAYIHTSAIPAGDLKHYAITLMQKGVQVITIGSLPNAAEQVTTRGASVLQIDSPLPDDPSFIGHIIPLQLLAYYTAKTLGHNIDKPRNIAKSVTVK